MTIVLEYERAEKERDSARQCMLIWVLVYFYVSVVEQNDAIIKNEAPTKGLFGYKS